MLGKAHIVFLTSKTIIKCISILQDLSNFFNVFKGKTLCFIFWKTVQKSFSQHRFILANGARGPVSSNMSVVQTLLIQCEVMKDPSFYDKKICCMTFDDIGLMESSSKPGCQAQVSIV